MPQVSEVPAPTKKTAKPKNKQKTVKQERKVVYPNVEVLKCLGDKALTAQEAKKYLAWQTEEEYKELVLAENPKAKEHQLSFGDDYMLTDYEGNKVRCQNNDHNRPFDEAWSKGLAQDMLRKNWAFNGENVIIGVSGRVLSGQHRLAGLVLAQQILEGSQKDHWAKDWPTGTITIETLLARGIPEDHEVTRTLDNTKPRTLADVIYTSTDLFGNMPAVDQKSLSRMLDYAVRLLWHRTGCKDDAFTPRQTHSEALDFLGRHKKLETAVKEIWDTYHQDGQTSWKICSAMMSPGYAAALLFLMGSAASVGRAYWEEVPATRTQKKLDWSYWDQAKAFWDALAAGEDALAPLREALAELAQHGGGSRAERTAVVAKAWQLHATEQPLDEESLELEYATKEGGIRYLDETPAVGGIDKGDPKNPNPWSPLGEVTQEEEEKPPTKPSKKAAAEATATSNHKAKANKPAKNRNARDSRIAELRAEYPGKILAFKTSTGAYRLWGSDAEAAGEVMRTDPYTEEGDPTVVLEWVAAEWPHVLDKLLDDGHEVVINEYRGKEWVAKVMSRTAEE